MFSQASVKNSVHMGALVHIHSAQTKVHHTS